MIVTSSGNRELIIQGSLAAGVVRTCANHLGLETQSDSIGAFAYRLMRSPFVSSTATIMPGLIRDLQPPLKMRIAERYGLGNL